MIHYLHAYSPTLNQELSQFEFHGMTGGEHTQHTTAAEAQACADEFAAMLSESKHLDVADWQGRIKTQE